MVNAMNDTMQMVAAGINRPIKWIKTADNIIRHPDRTTTIAGQTLKNNEWMTIANKTNIALEGPSGRTSSHWSERRPG